MHLFAWVIMASMLPAKKKVYVIFAAIILVVVMGLYLLYLNKSKQLSVNNNLNNVAGNVPLVDPESIGKIVSDPATGKEFMSNQLIVEFEVSVTEEDSLALISRLGGRMLQRFTAVPLFLIEVKDAGDGVGARKTLATPVAGVASRPHPLRRFRRRNR